MSNTGNEATIIFKRTSNVIVNGTPIEAGDEIGVFTPDSLCVGAGVWSDTGTVFAVWGNNDMTDETDGIKPDERMHFRVWRQSTNRVFVQNEATFSDNSPANGEDTYTPNAIYVINSLVANDEIVSVPYERRLDGIPDKFTLHQNYPNPFNPSTAIRYDVPAAAHVTVEIYSLIGQRVAVLVDGFQQTGSYEIVFHRKDLSSGVYLYRMNAGDFVDTKKFILLQ